jgi:16S rRNA (guanine527-N7)-methyltransferase
MAERLLQRLPDDARRLFGLEIGAHDLEAMALYIRELAVWSKAMNLVGAASQEEIVGRHLLDSLATIRLLADTANIADMGSGAGFPGIPIGIVLRDAHVHLVEARRKRCSFLRHVCRLLDLGNVTVWEGRAEAWQPPVRMDAVTGRALRPVDIASLGARLLRPGGKLLIMCKSVTRPLELAGFGRDSSIRYELPGGESHRVDLFRSTA